MILLSRIRSGFARLLRSFGCYRVENCQDKEEAAILIPGTFIFIFILRRIYICIVQPLRTVSITFFSFFSIPFISSIFALLFYLPPSHNSAPGSHSRLLCPPTHYGSCLAFHIARRFQLFLPSSPRVELCLPTLGAFSSYPFFYFC